MATRKILQAQVKTIDDKNHIRIWNESEIESITFKENKIPSKTITKHVNLNESSGSKTVKFSLHKKIKKVLPKKKL